MSSAWSVRTRPLLAISAAWLPANAIAAAGWLLMTVGILLGCLLGLWFWVSSRSGPDGVDDPFSPGRMVLVGSGVRSMVVIATNTPLDNVSELG